MHPIPPSKTDTAVWRASTLFAISSPCYRFHGGRFPLVFSVISGRRSLKDRGIAIIFEKENINTLTESSEFLITLFSSFSQAESESMGLNIVMGMR